MTLKELETAEPNEILETYLDQKKLFNFEGDNGVERLNQLAKALGYKGHGFRFGSSLETLLADNPGACNSLVEFIRENMNDCWAEELANELELEEDEEMEEETEEKEQ